MPSYVYTRTKHYVRPSPSQPARAMLLGNHRITVTADSCSSYYYRAEDNVVFSSRVIFLFPSTPHTMVWPSTHTRGCRLHDEYIIISI